MDNPIRTPIPGIAARHAIITDRCREVQGGGRGTRFHIVLSVDYPRAKRTAPTEGGR